MRPVDRRRAARLVLVAALVLVGPTACSDDAPRAGDGTATIVAVADRRPAPTLRGTTLEGSALDIADLRGSVVVLNVWGSWCAPCKKEQPDLLRAADALAADGVRFVGINVRDRTRGNALAHYRRYGVSYPSFFDPSARLVRRFDDLPPSAVPTTLVVDRDGRIAARVLGGTTYDELVALVRRVA